MKATAKKEANEKKFGLHASPKKRKSAPVGPKVKQVESALQMAQRQPGDAADLLQGERILQILLHGRNGRRPQALQPSDW